MIVVDTNLIAYFFIHGKFSELAEKVFKKDFFWTAPLLWRSEFRSVLLKSVKGNYMTFEVAVQTMKTAEGLIRGREFLSNSKEVLHAAVSSKISAYDAEFICLAREMGIALVTMDKKILKKFPKNAQSPESFLAV